MPNFLSRLAAASKNPSLPGRETADANTANPELYDRLIKNTDRLRELIATAKAALELVLTL